MRRGRRLVLLPQLFNDRHVLLALLMLLMMMMMMLLLLLLLLLLLRVGPPW
jgi:hypothetical protein